MTDLAKLQRAMHALDVDAVTEALADGASALRYRAERLEAFTGEGTAVLKARATLHRDNAALLDALREVPEVLA